MLDTRLTPAQLEAAVDFAYGGGAYRAGRRSQARTLFCLLRRGASLAGSAGVPHRAKG